MSHFTVLVIGDDIDGQLAPFDENLVVEEHDNFLSDEDVARMKEYYEKQGKDVSTLEKLSKFMDEWNGTPGFISSNGRLYYKSTYNPDSKWDWYQVGGRWTGFFKLKDGRKGEVGEPGVMTDTAPEGYADSVRKGDIDFKKIQDDARLEATKSFKIFQKAVGKKEFPPSWNEVLAKHGDNLEAARNEFHDNPVRKAVKDALAKKGLHFFMEDPFEYYGKDMEKFVARKVASCFQTYAVVHEGKWYQRGDMGWFGMSSNEKDEDVWNEEFMKLIDGLSDDTLLTVVDCHI